MTFMRKLFIIVLLGLFSFCATNSSAQQRTLEKRLAEQVANSFIWRFPYPDVIRWGGQENHYSWQAGYIMFAMEHLWLLTGNPDYLLYIRRYVEQNVTEEGDVPGFQPRALDNFLPDSSSQRGLLRTEVIGKAHGCTTITPKELLILKVVASTDHGCSRRSLSHRLITVMAC